MRERIQKIIAAGIMAPSGDNCQPWSFAADGKRIDIFNLPERDRSLYNYQQRASLVANGACIENMIIAARHYGLRAEPAYFPDPGNPQHLARLELSEAERQDEPLFAAIATRGINRKPYRGGQLSPHAADSLRQAASPAGSSGCAFKLLQGNDKNSAAEVAALSDRLVFENPHLHGFLFEQIRWTPQEAESTRDGLDIRTLELAPPDRLLFPLLKNFGLVKLIARFGATRLIAANAKKLMLSASATGIITISDDSSASWLHAGRMLERVWLEASRQGLAFHLMTGITLMAGRVRDGALEGLDSGNLSLIRQADSLLKKVSGTESPVALLFRIGTAPQPSARSLRRNPDNIIG